jgi:hypothetical protein
MLANLLSSSRNVTVLETEKVRNILHVFWERERKLK